MQELNPPTELVAKASTGLNTLTWNGKNAAGAVTYEIWRLNGDTLPFAVLARVSEPVFEDRSVTAGEYYIYKVRAVAGTAVSEFSNDAVVYGAN